MCIVCNSSGYQATISLCACYVALIYSPAVLFCFVPQQNKPHPKTNASFEIVNNNSTKNRTQP